jgi:hypothetical protein
MISFSPARSQKKRGKVDWLKICESAVKGEDTGKCDKDYDNAVLETGRFAFWFAKTDPLPPTAFLVKQEEIKDLSGFEEMFEVAATRIKISDHQLRRAGETQPL